MNRLGVPWAEATREPSLEAGPCEGGGVDGCGAPWGSAVLGALLRCSWLLAWIAAWAGAAGCGQRGEQSGTPLQGVVEYDEQALAFEVGGRVVEIPVHRGQAVGAGTVLAQLDPALQTSVREMRAADVQAADAELSLLRAGARGEDLEAVESEVAALQARATSLQKDLARQRVLQKGSALAQSVVDKTEGELKATSDQQRALSARLTALRSGARTEEISVAAARLRRAQAALSVEELRLSQHRLQALKAGVIVDIQAQAGETVAAGVPVVVVADLTHPYVDTFVPQSIISRFQLGKGVQVAVDGLEESLRGRVEHISRRLEFTPRFVFSEGERPNLVLRVRVRVEDPSHRLHSGLPAFVSL